MVEIVEWPSNSLQVCQTFNVLKEEGFPKGYPKEGEYPNNAPKEEGYPNNPTFKSNSKQLRFWSFFGTVVWRSLAVRSKPCFETLATGRLENLQSVAF